ncbi:hypothetical protein NW762_004083 [Fusarium torreyae]|uniref:Cas1p 10 TM acyl transferase domain-containing protein n=1 Tax=Fusarium torreyae TaxID=1237075 RepID=A0A9W8VJX8_9HYPO|nr:hypothetical protein NW762_004083 [Fusarium torreyae]
MDRPLTRISSIVLATIFLLAVGLKTAFPGDDPYRCRAVQRTGRWIDPPDENGNRVPFHHWQPDGCILHQYDSADIRRCTEGRSLVVVGDSTSRNVGHAFARLLNKEQSHLDRGDTPRDWAFNMTYRGQLIQRLPSAWLNAHGYPKYAGFAQQLDMLAYDKQKSLPIKKQEGPAMIYITAGPWFTQNYSCGPWEDYEEPPEWEEKFDYFKSSFTNLSNWVRDNVPQIDPFTAPMDPIDGVGNQIFFAPPNKPRYQGNETEKVLDNLRRREEITKIQDWLRENEDEFALPLLWSIPHLMEGENKTVIDPGKKGFHVRNPIAEYRANVLLNLRCNAKLDIIKPYPYEHTCCTDYGLKTNVQLGIVAACIIYLVACIVSEILDLAAKREEPQWGLLNMQAGCFPLALLMCYYSDRTQMMAKGIKLWRYEDFFALLIPCIIIALATIRRSRSPPPKDLSLTEKKEDQPFLSRDQTEEWKGWMQFTILIYHWIDAKPTSIYILVRLCVAAYLFQTGYGHTLFFLNKKDFSFNRAAAVLLRLNLLPCALAYIMDTDYMFYYFSPLVSFWFLVVYMTMALGGKRYNSDLQFVLAKIWLSCVLISTLFFKTHVTKHVFSVLRSVLNIQWSHEEWQYRVTLDMFIVYVGMLVAVVKNEMGKRPIHLGLQIILAVAGFYAIYNYFAVAEPFGSKRYRTWHPYGSFIPVLAFIAIRNASAPVRNFYSKAMAWLGRCSLETYILQFHLLLAADTNGILIVDGLFGDGTVIGDRWRSLAIILPIFLWISHATASSTGHFVKLIMHQPPETTKLGEPAYAWLEKVPGGSYISAPRIRIVCIILVLWLLNVMSPEHREPRPPNGIHHVHIDDAAPLKYNAAFDPAVNATFQATINATLDSLNSTTA